jgi:uncharacterized protein YeaO (DUF488 family)
MTVQTKRIYDEPEPDDGTRILVDRLWPRGVSKEEAQLDDWMKEVAPSDGLRAWFDHDPDRWEGFQDRYQKELEHRTEQIDALLEHAGDGTLTLLYGASDEKHNNAIVLEDYLTEILDERSS